MDTMPGKIGRYEIKSQLGKGGMSIVYLGHDPFSGRDVAIKVLPSELSSTDPQFHLRFQDEIRISANLEHPSIVPVYDVGEEKGQPYLVMRHMRGGTLAEKIENGPLSLDEAVRILERIAPALDEAHTKRVVHRDIKPKNILFDNYDTPSISDFGIAKVLETQSSGLNRTGLIGTLAYMSPEQVEEKPVDGRADIYSLGIVFYEMLSGERPHDALTRVTRTEAEPYPHILEINKDLPPWVETVISRAIALDRNERFTTAGEMLKMIKEHMQSDESVRRKNAGQVQVNSLAIISLLVILGLAGGGILLQNFFKPTPTSTPIPSTTTTIHTPVVSKTSTHTPIPTETTTVTPVEETIIPIPSLPALGGADKIAFLRDNNIWIMNVDGTDLQSLTNDRNEKHNIEWLPDGNTILYITGKTIKTVNIETKQEEIITSFGASPYFDAFRVSPDGKQVAISLARELHVVPFDLKKFKRVATRNDLLALNGCIHSNAVEVEEIIWSGDGERLAVKFAAASVGTLKDRIRIIDIHLCRDSVPLRVHQFPEEFFAYRDKIVSYDWDGESLFFLNDVVRNDGFGNLGIYNNLTFLYEKIAPIDNMCCYRDATFSPDGTYVLFAFQDIRLGDRSPIVLYYLPIGLLEANANFQPLPLPDGFFTKRDDTPIPALRPVPE